MSDFSDFCAQIADFANRQDWSANLVTSFVRMAEQKFNAELRVDRMVAFAEGQIMDRCALLPDDWLEMDLVKVENSNGADGFLPARYKSRDEFFNLSDKNSFMYYTLEGRQMYFGGTPDDIEGVAYQIMYYGEVPVFSDTVTSWVYTKYPTLYLFGALIHSDLYAVGEEPKAAQLKQFVEDQITKLNSVHLKAKASGSRLRRTRVRSFG